MFFPKQIVASNVLAVAAGPTDSFFLKTDGSLWAMGENFYGQLGTGSFTPNIPPGINLPEQIILSNVVAIAAGESHSLFLKNDGSVWGTGTSSSGELGAFDSVLINQAKPIIASGVKAIAAGQSDSFYLKDDGSLWGMGSNDGGQLGNGTNSYATLPEQIIANPYYNQLLVQNLDATRLKFSFYGKFGGDGVLEHSFDLSSSIWISQMTNTANSFGLICYTNTPNSALNNFWRIHSLP